MLKIFRIESQCQEDRFSSNSVLKIEYARLQFSLSKQSIREIRERTIDCISTQ